MGGQLLAGLDDISRLILAFSILPLDILPDNVFLLERPHETSTLSAYAARLSEVQLELLH